MNRFFRRKSIIRFVSSISSSHYLIPQINCRFRHVSWFSIALFEDAKVHRLLKDIPVGKMSAQDLNDAHAVIYKCCETQSYEHAERAEIILNRLITEQRDGGNQSVHIPISVYVSLLEAYAKCKTEEASPISAHNLLQRMIQSREEFQPNTSGLYGLHHSPLNQVFPLPDVACYNAVLSAWAHSSHPLALEKMESLIRFLENNVATGSYPQPNTSSYNLLINAYANRASQYGYAQKAEDVLLKMANLNSQNQPHVKPSSTSFNIVLKAWKNCREGIECAQRAESILSLMLKVCI